MPTVLLILRPNASRRGEGLVRHPMPTRNEVPVDDPPFVMLRNVPRAATEAAPPRLSGSERLWQRRLKDARPVVDQLPSLNIPRARILAVGDTKAFGPYLVFRPIGCGIQLYVNRASGAIRDRGLDDIRATGHRDRFRDEGQAATRLKRLDVCPSERLRAGDPWTGLPLPGAIRALGLLLATTG